MKIGLLCSKGGHLQEMMNIKDAWEKYDHFFVTYKSERIKYLDERKYLVVDPMDGGIKYLFTLARALCKVFGERPDVLISTGMGWVDIFMFPFCKLLGTYTIYIESAANTDYITGTAKLVRHFADKFMVQWEELAEEIGCEYHGGVM